MLSITLRWGKSSKDWKTIPILDRTSLMLACGVLICSSLRYISPSVGSMSRLMHLRTVDLPLPEEPIMATDSPSFTLNEIPLTACTPPEYTLCRFSILSRLSVSQSPPVIPKPGILVLSSSLLSNRANVQVITK